MISSIIYLYMLSLQQITKNITMSNQNQSSQLDIQFHINRDQNNIQLSNYKQQLQYIILSTEPGRIIQYPGQYKDNKLIFKFKRCQGISMESQGYCVIGVLGNQSIVKQIRQSKIQKKSIQKHLYLSKLHIMIKNKWDSNHKVMKQLQKLNARVMPPQQLTGEQIQQLLQKTQKNYGSFINADTKKNCLILSFKEDVEIGESFIIQSIEQIKQCISIVYWAITNHRTMYTFQPNKIYEFPIKTHIRFFQIHYQWLIVATSHEVLFFNLYRPADYCKRVQKLKIQAMCALNRKIYLFEYKYLSIYELLPNYVSEKLIGVKTKKIQCFTICNKKKTVLLGGINYSFAFNTRLKQKQIYIIDNFTFEDKDYHADRMIKIAIKDKDTPIINLKYLVEINLFICSCGESIYLFHLESSNIIASVDLCSTVGKVFQIQYPINILNFLVKAQKQKNLIRISFQQYGSLFGAEVTNVEKYGQPKDCYAKQKNVYTIDGELILLYENNDKKKVLYGCDQEQKIKYISVFDESLAFLVQRANIFSAFFIQF